MVNISDERKLFDGGEVFVVDKDAFKGEGTVI